MPSIVSSCSTVAVPRLIGPSSIGAGRDRGGPAGPALGHHHLLPVGQPGGEVDRFQLRLAALAPPARSTASSTRLPAGSR